MQISQIYTEYPECVHIEFYIHKQNEYHPDPPIETPQTKAQDLTHAKSHTQTENCVDTEIITTHRPRNTGSHTQRETNTDPRITDIQIK